MNYYGSQGPYGYNEDWSFPKDQITPKKQFGVSRMCKHLHRKNKSKH